jgi:hypothetical protein
MHVLSWSCHKSCMYECVCNCVCVCVYVYVCICICIYVYIHTHVYTFIHPSIHPSIHPCICVIHRMLLKFCHVRGENPDFVLYHPRGQVCALEESVIASMKRHACSSYRRQTTNALRCEMQTQSDCTGLTRGRKARRSGALSAVRTACAAPESSSRPSTSSPAPQP